MYETALRYEPDNADVHYNVSFSKIEHGVLYTVMCLSIGTPKNN